jgi:hypothetical protein
MIRPLAFWRPSEAPIAIATDSRSQLGKTEDPSLTQLASADRVRARDPAAGKLSEKTAANSDELCGFLSGDKRFGYHDGSPDH